MDHRLPAAQLLLSLAKGFRLAKFWPFEHASAELTSLTSLKGLSNGLFDQRRAETLMESERGR